MSETKSGTKGGAPSERQALILWCLLGRQGEAPQAEIAPKIGKADREALTAGGYLAVAKQGRSLRLTVTDQGWAWAGGHLRAALPPAHRALQDWLARLDAHLAATGATLAEFVGEAPQVPAAPEKPAEKRKATKPATGKPAAGTSAPARKPSPARLRARIEAAYLALTDGAKAKAVRLSALRAELADLDRATVDAGLAAILRADDKAALSQFSDPRSLTPAEHDAAFSPAGEPFHILWIEP